MGYQNFLEEVSKDVVHSWSRQPPVVPLALEAVTSEITSKTRGHVPRVSVHMVFPEF